MKKKMRQYLCGMVDAECFGFKPNDYDPPAYAAGLRMGWIARKNFERKGGRAKFLKTFAQKALDKANETNETVPAMQNAESNNKQTEVKTMNVQDIFVFIAESNDFNQLTELEKAVAERKAIIAESAKMESMNKLREAAKAMGIDLDALLASGRKPRASHEPVAPKFRDPANPANTWSGRGRAPGWLQAYVNAGRQADEFRIAAPAPAPVPAPAPQESDSVL